MDFITDLPPSNGNTSGHILVIVDRFSKSFRLLPLKGLPTAIETADNLFNQVFQYFSIPEDIVSDRGPQLISRVWKAFSLLNVTVSLSSGYHPQTNGQTERKIQEILELGTSSWAGPSTHRTSFANHPPDSLLSSACSGTSPLISPGQANQPKFHRSTTGSERAKGSGMQLTTNCNELYADVK